MAAISPFTIMEAAEEPIENGIYVPYFLKSNGYEIGDTVKFDYNGELFTYLVAGYFETTWFGTTVSSVITFYLPEEAYQELYRQIGGGKFLSVRLNDPSEAEMLRQEFRQEMGLTIDSAGRNVASFDGSFDEMQSISVMIPNVMAAIMMGFSIIVFLIIFLVIRFRIYRGQMDGRALSRVEFVLCDSDCRINIADHLLLLKKNKKADSGDRFSRRDRSAQLPQKLFSFY